MQNTKKTHSYDSNILTIYFLWLPVILGLMTQIIDSAQHPLLNYPVLQFLMFFVHLFVAAIFQMVSLPWALAYTMPVLKSPLSCPSYSSYKY